MIFVTTGTTHHDSRLIVEIDRLAGAREIKDDVVAQISTGEYIPSNIAWTRYVDNISAYYDASALVICYGGATVFELLQAGKKFIAVPNRLVQDDHQADVLRALERRGWIVCCFELERLAGLINKTPNTIPYPRGTALADDVWTYLLSRKNRAQERRVLTDDTGGGQAGVGAS